MIAIPFKGSRRTRSGSYVADLPKNRARNRGNPSVCWCRWGGKEEQRTAACPAMGQYSEGGGHSKAAWEKFAPPPARRERPLRERVARISIHWKLGCDYGACSRAMSSKLLLAVADF